MCVGNNGIVVGDLILKGGGDPWLVKERFWLLLRELRQRGIQRIEGDLVIDDSLFDDAAIARHTLDGRVHRAYNTRPSAVLTNFAVTLFRIRRTGEKLAVDVEPPAVTLRVQNQVIPLSGTCAGRIGGIKMDVVSQGPEQTTVRFHGKYPPTCGEHRRLRRVLPHHQYVYGLFRSLWEEMGGSQTGGWRTGQVPEKARLWVNFKSVPLSAVTRNINKYSNNVMAEAILKTLGAADYGYPGTASKGLAVVAKFRNEALGTSLTNYVQADGSGLSNLNRVSPRQVVELLQHAHSDFHFGPEFVSSMKISGMDGFNPRPFRDPPLVGELRLKSGHIRGVNTLSGYAHAESGRTVAFCIMINGHKSQQWEIDLRVAELSKIIRSSY